MDRDMYFLSAYRAGQESKVIGIGCFYSIDDVERMIREQRKLMPDHTFDVRWSRVILRQHPERIEHVLEA